MPVSSCVYVYFTLHLLYHWNSLKSKLRGFRWAPCSFFPFKIAWWETPQIHVIIRLRFCRYLRLNRKIYFWVGLSVGNFSATHMCNNCHLGFLICQFSYISLCSIGVLCVWTISIEFKFFSHFFFREKQIKATVARCVSWNWTGAMTPGNDFAACKTSKYIQKFGFIKRVDKGWITTVKDLESWRF